MAGKKRAFSPDEEVAPDAAKVSAEAETQIAAKKKKKVNKEKKTVAGKKDISSVDVPTPTATGNVKPMEKKKKKKAFDKERHWIANESKEKEKEKENKPVKESPQVDKMVDTSPSLGAESNGFPVFHISTFNRLASADACIRESAAETLVQELKEVQIAYEKVGDQDMIEASSKLDAEKDDGLDECAPSVRYAVRRLIRGVSSSRECARQGFALGLTMLVGLVPKIRVNPLLKLIGDSLEVSSSMKGQEVRDCLLGRLFAYAALTRSGRLKEEWLSDQNTPYIKELTRLLVSLASQKRYLQEPAVSVLLNIIESFPEEAIIKHVLDAPALHEWFDGATDAGNPDALLLALRIREKISVDNPTFGKLLPYPFSPTRLFSVEHLSSLANCLKESSFCQPRVHGIWPVLLNILLPDAVLQESNGMSSLNSIKKHKRSRKSGSSDDDVAQNLKCFSEVILEGSLLLSSHDRKHLAFDIILVMLPRLPATCIPIVLSDKFVQCLMDTLSAKNTWLHKYAEHFLKELTSWVKEDDVKRVFVIASLQRHSNGRFDCITRTKTVKDLMSEFTTESGCMFFIQKLTNMFLDEGQTSDEPSDQSQTTDENSEIGSTEDKDSLVVPMKSDLLKSWIVESLPNFLKYLKMDPDAKFRVQKEVMKFLAVQGLFASSLGTEVTSFDLQEKFQWPRTAISGALCRMCVEQLQLLLCSAQKSGGSLAAANGLEANDLLHYFMRFLSTLCNIPSVSLVRPLSHEDEKAFKDLQAMESHLAREERNCGLSTVHANKLHALRYLLIQLLLQLLLRPGEFVEAVLELTMCCRKAFSIQDLDSSDENDPEIDESAHLMDVLVDTLLSLLPQSSAPLRSAVEQVFKYFCSEVTEDGLLRMLRVVKKDFKSPRHRDEDSEDDDEDDDFLGIEEAEESDEGEMGETSGGDERADDSEAVDVVGAAGEVPEASDDSEDGMDDDAMFRMDSYLARIFQERKNQAGGDSAQSQLILFKLRVLSLLEIYLHENPGSPHVLTICSNLVRVFVNPHTAEVSEQLAQRIWGILQKKVFNSKDYPKGESVTLSTLEPMLEKSLRLASRPKKKKSAANPLKEESAAQSKKKQSAGWNAYKLINSLPQTWILWILKIIDAGKFKESELNRVMETLQQALTAYFDSKKSQLKPAFFLEIFKRRPWVGHHLLSFLFSRCRDGKIEYRRVEALELLFEALKCRLRESGSDASKKILKSHLTELRGLIKYLVMHMPEKQSRRAAVRKFSAKIFGLLSANNLAESFLKKLELDAFDACKSHLGGPFLALKKVEI